MVTIDRPIVERDIAEAELAVVLRETLGEFPPDRSGTWYENAARRLLDRPRFVELDASAIRLRVGRFEFVTENGLGESASILIDGRPIDWLISARIDISVGKTGVSMEFDPIR